MIGTFLVLAPLLGNLSTRVSHDAGGPGIFLVGIAAIGVVGIGLIVLIVFAVKFLAKMRDRSGGRDGVPPVRR